MEVVLAMRTINVLKGTTFSNREERSLKYLRLRYVFKIRIIIVLNLVLIEGIELKP